MRNQQSNSKTPFNNESRRNFQEVFTCDVTQFQRKGSYFDQYERPHPVTLRDGDGYHDDENRYDDHNDDDEDLGSVGNDADDEDIVNPIRNLEIDLDDDYSCGGRNEETATTDQKLHDILLSFSIGSLSLKSLTVPEEDEDDSSRTSSIGENTIAQI
ncbi:hypothetical protein ACA910_000335 [Epithemia clementina (nom. ined.)]